MTFKRLGVALVTSSALATAHAAMAPDPDDDWSGIDSLVLNWSQLSTPFFEAVNTGAMNAAEDQGVTIDIQFGEEDPVTTSNILETAVANEVEVEVIADDNAYDEILCRAQEQGIVVVTYNIDDSQGAAGICR